jgi:hypothetical protein
MNHAADYSDDSRSCHGITITSEEQTEPRPHKAQCFFAPRSNFFLTASLVLIFCVRCFNRQRLSRVAEGTGPLKPQQPGATAKVLIPAQVGRDKILD